MMGPQEIVDWLGTPSVTVYPQEAVAAALAQREAMVPMLLDVLADFCRDPGPFLKGDHGLRATYAALLLGYFREPLAHARLLAVAALPEETLHYFGDAITEDFATLFQRTSHGESSGLQALVRDPAASVWCRDAALRALVLMVADGSLARAQAVSFLADLLRDFPQDMEIWSRVAEAACELCAVELLPTLRRGYDEGLIEGFAVSPDDLDEAAEADPEETLARMLARDQERHPADFHKWVSWWACYSRAHRAHSAEAQSAAAHRRPSPEQARKKRCKQERQARRRGRRRR